MPRPGSNRHRRHEVLAEKPEFQQGQQVVRILKACGENIYEAEKESGEAVLYQLPSRLRNVAFIRRGSFVFARDDPTRGPGKVRGDIEVVILDRYMKELRKEAFWPHRFKQENTGSTEYHDEKTDNEEDDEDSDWEVGAGNPNRRRLQHDEDSESENEA